MPSVSRMDEDEYRRRMLGDWPAEGPPDMPRVLPPWDYTVSEAALIYARHPNLILDRVQELAEAMGFRKDVCRVTRYQNERAMTVTIRFEQTQEDVDTWEARRRIRNLNLA